MNVSRRVLLSLVAMLFAVSPFALIAADSGDAKWTEDFKAAVAASKKTGKPIMIDFTGSDWCGYCKVQHKEVFGTAEWQKWAADNVILVTADYPRKAQNAAVKKQNEELKKTYKPEGFPTIIFIDAKGTELGRWAGYGPGTGAEKWIAKADPIVAKAKKAE